MISVSVEMMFAVPDILSQRRNATTNVLTNLTCGVDFIIIVFLLPYEDQCD